MTVTCGGKGRTAPKETLLKVVLLGVGLMMGMWLLLLLGMKIWLCLYFCLWL